VTTETGAAPLPYDWNTELPGVISRHADSCPVRDGGRCTCGPLGYLASIRDRRTNQRRVSPLVESVDDALVWRWEEIVREDDVPVTGVSGESIATLIDEFRRAAEDGSLTDDHGQRYSQQAVRALQTSLSFVDAELGTLEVQDLRRRHVQALVDQLSGSGVAPERVLAMVDALKDAYTYAIRRELVGFNPVVELQLPQYSNGGPPTEPAITADSAQRGWTSNEPTPPPQPAPPPAEPAPPTDAAQRGWTSDELTQPPQPGPPPAQPAPPTDATQRSWSSEELAQPTHPAGPPWTPPPFDLYQGTAAGPPAAEPPQYAPPGYTSTPPSWSPPQPGYPTTPNAYTAPYLPPGYPPGTTPFPQAPPYGQPSTGFSSIFGTSGDPAATDVASMQERWLWWTVRIIVIVFVLIALVLVAESV
jgi:hypothetical protein